ncbi:MAG: rhomboid family intramembrane serine protease [Bacteroidota bacterium]|jgi:membrane associated rhomboid family serine protease|nr:rhomboid family intramembrane serine protease [Flavobacteriaceae bacterium]MEC7870305.1 rhomboid family intramembrane serine protease [Bacteroidota bacterium]MEC8615450.1 rhomboid family intramembrane serine protease [Bacteroidota bacterium]|tara:strand:+ start:1239 stop:1979 length:741 start_codon:yes stop_codon:yes gene_type:complete
MRGISDLIKHLVIINVIFFFSTFIFGNIVYDLFALHYFENEKFEYWQLLSHMFMHGNINHILFNMFGLWMFGSPLEKMWGKNKFLFFYISAGLGAAALQMIMYYVQFSSISDQIIQLGYGTDSLNKLLNEGLYDPRILEVVNESDLIDLIRNYNSSMVGASGAIYGILVAFALIFPNSELFILFLPFPIKAKFLVPILILGDIFFGFSSYSVGPIAHFAHIGGALTGFLIMWYWKKNQFNKNRWDL